MEHENLRESQTPVAPDENHIVLDQALDPPLEPIDPGPEPDQTIDPAVDFQTQVDYQTE